MPRFSFVPTMNANNNCTHPRRLTRTHVESMSHPDPRPSSVGRDHVRVPSAVVLLSEQCGQLVEPARFRRSS